MLRLLREILSSAFPPRSLLICSCGEADYRLTGECDTCYWYRQY